MIFQRVIFFQFTLELRKHIHFLEPHILFNVKPDFDIQSFNVLKGNI